MVSARYLLALTALLGSLVCGVALAHFATITAVLQ
jgi:hypothetical protein